MGKNNFLDLKKYLMNDQRIRILLNLGFPPFQDVLVPHEAIVHILQYYMVCF